MEIRLKLKAVEKEEGVEEEKKNWEGRKHYEAEVGFHVPRPLHAHLTLSRRRKLITTVG